MVELALVFPLFTLVLGGLVLLGVGVFYQQELTNAAREAARYAAIHSATSQCPTTSWLSPQWSQAGSGIDQNVYFDCDPPSLRWPEMSSYGRSKVFGLDASKVYFAACWSGYWDDDNQPMSYDAGPVGPDQLPNNFHECTIGGIDPRTATSSISCPPPLTTSADDKSSDLAASGGFSANQVTVYACYQWNPPGGGLKIPIPCSTGWCSVDLIPSTMTMRATITEAMQYQQ